MRRTKYETLDNRNKSIITDEELEKLKFLGIDNIEFLIGLIQAPQTRELVKEYLGRDDEGLVKLTNDFMAIRGDLMESMMSVEVKEYPLGLALESELESPVERPEYPITSVLLGEGEAMPDYVNLIDKLPEIRHQGQRGTCTAFACCALREYLTGDPDMDFSEQFLYWACQLRDNPLGIGSEGTCISTAMSVLKEMGVCLEETWPYVKERKKPYHQGPPPKGAEEEALRYRLLDAERIPISVDEVCSALARGYPVAVGIPVYKSWSNPHTYLTGRINMPFPLEMSRGGHAILIVAYDKEEGIFVFRNSWGEKWAAEGDYGAGHGIIPMRYLNLGHAAWIGQAEITPEPEKPAPTEVRNEPRGHVVLGGSRSGNSLLGLVNDPNPSGVVQNAPIHIDTVYENDGWHVIFICGQAGSGKSHTLSVIIENIVLDNEKNKAVVIIDAEGEHWSFKEPSKDAKELRTLKLEPQSFPAKVLVPKGNSSHKAIPDGTFSFAISDLNLDDWCMAFKIRGERQVPLMRRLIECMEKGWTYINEDLGIREDIGPTEDYGIGDLIQCLNHDAEINNPKIGYPKGVIRGVNNILSEAKRCPWLEADGTPIEEIAQPGQISVMDVSGVSDDRERVIITELVARKLFDARHRADKIPPVYLVVDEAHLFAPKEKKDMSAPSLVKIAKRGRKKGVSLICATQQPSATDDELISQVTLMVGHILTMANDIRAWRDRTPKIKGRPDLTVENLKTGEAVVSDRKNTDIPPLRIKIRPRMSRVP